MINQMGLSLMSGSVALSFSRGLSGGLSFFKIFEMLLWHHQCLKIHNKVSFCSNVSETCYDHLRKDKNQPYNLLILANFGEKIQIFETHRILKGPNERNFLAK